MKTKNYALVTAGYWSFTLTDGALRMLVLLHFHELGYSPVSIAFLFLAYEFMGIVTNLLGGWVGSRTGLNRTLVAGLVLQIVALIALVFQQATWHEWVSIVFVMSAQALSGVAKDLTKMSSKSAMKAVAGNGDGALFRLVAILTGSKNALKGVGFFLGAALLAWIGYDASLISMAAMLAVTVGALLILLDEDIGRSKKKAPLRSILSKSSAVNRLSAARFFLFGSRDIWFVVALPVFLDERLHWSYQGIGAFLAVWVIGYGIIQSFAPRILRRRGDLVLDEIHAAQRWALILAVISAAIAVAVAFEIATTVAVVGGLVVFGAAFALNSSLHSFLILAVISAAIAVAVAFEIATTVAVVGGLVVFGAAFALNSSLHSFLILAYSDDDTVALDVGFYYSANAAGRLVGTLLSGLLYLWGGLPVALWGSAAFVAVAWLLTLRLPAISAGPSHGSVVESAQTSRA